MPKETDNIQQYSVITFAPVQGFIEKSRKLRDLYGSSYILSLLSWVICQCVKKLGYEIVSPALPNVTQGMPNQIVIKGKVSQGDLIRIKDTFDRAWKCLVYSCKEWIEDNITNTTKSDYRYWRRDWQLWVNYGWEFFSASGETITKARNKLNQAKNSRDWTGINWQGESSTLSGSDAICQPLLGQPKEPHEYDYQGEKKVIRAFYQKLSSALGEAFVDASEELSIPELVKRMITHQTIVNQFATKLNLLDLDLPAEKITELSKELNPTTFRDLNRHKEKENEQKYWTGWFLGDGDNASKYFKSLAQLSPEEEEKGLSEFSEKIREWGGDLKKNEDNYLQRKGRMVYAGGDDFLGVLYDGAKPFFPTDNQAKLSPYDCLKWFYSFKSKIWHGDKPKIITASVGFVWAGNQVPQRDVLQHCHLAESSAKSTGRDRIAFRILFNSGNYLEWVCPWWLLDTGEWIFKGDNQQREVYFPDSLKEDLQSLKSANLNLIESYFDRARKLLKDGGNWTHFYQDIATLESRHAFNKKVFSQEELNQGNIDISNDIALSLINIYFGEKWHKIISNPNHWFNQYDDKELLTFAGILGDPKQFLSDYQPENYPRLIQHPTVKQALDNWVISLAKIGFYLTDE